MMGSFLRDCLLPGLGMCVVVGFVVWLAHVINSIARSADALERIADALEEDTKKEGDAKCQQ